MIKLPKMFQKKSDISNNIKNKENINEVNVKNRNEIDLDGKKEKKENISTALCKLLNAREKKFKEISLSFLAYSNVPTKKLKFANNNELSLKKQNYKMKTEIKELFHIQNEHLKYEIEFFCHNPSFNYDFEHQNDNNFNFYYINENFVDILLLSYRGKLILHKNIKPMKSIQKEITFQKRNILISWLTEINMKYVKDQNILFLAVKFLDQLLYKQNVNINDFQLIGILCLNLASKLENYHTVMRIDEIISLTSNGEIKDNKIRYKLTKKIKATELNICNILNFDLHQSTSVMILIRLIQIMNIQDKNIENIFKSISYFFLELSLYDEDFYLFDEFTKSLSSVVLTKLILEQKNMRLGFHKFLKHCSLIKRDEIKKYLVLCQKNIKIFKNIKYGRTFLCKYQMVNFNCVVNTYLSDFIKKCFA